MNTPGLTHKDFASEADVRWCPGCGDYSILKSMQKVLPTLDIPKENFVIISGIGCSSRFPYYMNTYGFHTLHGRAPTVATGVKLANPDLSVWMITGDGDGFSIGTNHLVHLLRRNIGIKVLLFNNKVYGLTKGQYSPTSDLGMKTKSSPMGSLDNPINPLSIALSAGATFVARTVDKMPKHMEPIFQAAAAHPGTAFIEILQNCPIFNDKIWEVVTERKVQTERLLFLEDQKALTFGEDNNKALKCKNFGFEVTDPDDKDVHIHQAEATDNSYAQALSQLAHPKMPVPVGIFYQDKSKPVYENAVEKQIDDAIATKGKGDLATLLKGKNFWDASENSTDSTGG